LVDHRAFFVEKGENGIYAVHQETRRVIINTSDDAPEQKE
jgi:hypothetical protein